MYSFAWMLLRLLSGGSAQPGPAGPPDRTGRPAPDFTGMAVSMANRLSERRAAGEITRDQYRLGIEALAAADARRQPTIVPRF